MRARAGRFRRNINVVKDSVAGVLKNVVQLTAWNADDVSNCPGPHCHKLVTSNGALATAGVFGSGRFEVIAKVPAAPGLVWALWSFHYEEHLPANCAEYACWCADMPSNVTMISDECSLGPTGGGCPYPNLCDNFTDGWTAAAGPLSPEQCGASHAGDDPLFLRNASFAGWKTIGV